MKRLNYKLLISIILLAVQFNASAQLSQEELAKIAQDPLANMISLPIQTSFSYSMGPFDRTQKITNIQPVIPFADGKIISRVIVPIIEQPHLFSESGSTSGIGDVSISTFYASGEEKVKWGIGPIINLPTAEDGLGVQEWGIGPSLVAVIKPSNWVIGSLINNVWSLESDLSAFQLQPFINYNLPKEFYLASSPKITANWQADSEERWTIPLGMGFGKIIKPKHFLPLNVQVGSYYNVESPSLTGSDWNLRFTITALIPKAIFN